MRITLACCNGHGTQYLHYKGVNRILCRHNIVYADTPIILVDLGESWEFDEYYERYYAKRNKPCQFETLSEFNISTQKNIHVFNCSEVEIVDVYND